MKRVFFDIVLFLTILFLPWWAGFLMAFIGLFVFNNFYEYLAYGVIIFIFYGPMSNTLISSPVYFSLILTTSFTLIEFVKTNIIFYKK